MADTAANRFTCKACGKSYGWKAELAGKKVKCKCGGVMVVPAAPPPPEDDGILDLAPEEPVAPPPPKRRPAVAGASVAGASAIGATVPGIRKGKPGGVSKAGHPLANKRGQDVRNRETAVATVDMVRDVHVPTALLVIGFAAYLAQQLLTTRGGSANLILLSLMLGTIMIFKAALLMGFAFVVAGPLGVSFGGVWTATLKLAAMAIFCDGVVAWIDFGVDKMSGAHMRSIWGWGMVSYPVALGMYWVLMIYLFSMDPGDCWLVVVLLSLLDKFVKIILVMAVLSFIFRAAGAGGSGLAPLAIAGSVAGGSAARPGQSPTVAEQDAALDEHLDELKSFKMLPEARQYIKDGHQAILTQPTEDFYAAGAKNVWFEVSKDINGKTEPESYYVELPDDPAGRAKCFEILKKTYESLGRPADPDELKDTGSKYIEIGI